MFYCDLFVIVVEDMKHAKVIRKKTFTSGSSPDMLKCMVRFV